MKVVFPETPDRADIDRSIEFSMLPEGAEACVAVFDKDAADNSGFYEQIRDADIIINNYVYFDRKAIDAMERCRVISFESNGYNEVDFDYATEKGIGIVSIGEYCVQETAENAIAMMMCLQRRVLEYNRSVQENHEWNCFLCPGMQRIEGQTMAIFGLGHIGQHVARIAGKGLGMRVIAYDPFLPPEIAEGLGVQLVDMDTALAEADVISVHMNLTESNRYMFNRETFAKMKKRPFFINEGRGEMVREADLAWALETGVLRGAGIDMLESEHPDVAASPLMGKPNLIVMPHVGFWSDTSHYLVRKYCVDNALNYYYGKYDDVHVIRNGLRG